jgi:hypothetical protein
MISNKVKEENDDLKRGNEETEDGRQKSIFRVCDPGFRINLEPEQGI